MKFPKKNWDEKDEDEEDLKEGVEEKKRMNSMVMRICGS